MDDVNNVNKVSTKRIIFYVLIVICCLWAFIKADMDTLERGDTVRINEQTFGTSHYKIHEQLGSAAYHDDKIAILQLIDDGKARYIPRGAKGKVIMDASNWVEIRFDDDPLHNWWVKKRCVDRVK
ncbi:MAG: hypothetical protein HDR88_02360 [Bacteroides sp.]|nr:hypothetical protein [Bacteroides sp.]